MLSYEKGALTVGELEEIAEYEKIIEFARQVLAGEHPRVKIPAHLLVQSNTAAEPSVPAAATTTLVLRKDDDAKRVDGKASGMRRQKRRKLNKEASAMDEAASDTDSMRVWCGRD